LTALYPFVAAIVVLAAAFLVIRAKWTETAQAVQTDRQCAGSLKPLVKIPAVWKLGLIQVW
jgi:predicted outer membrane lipoprotein